MVNHRNNSSKNSSSCEEVICHVVFNAKNPENMGTNYYLLLIIALIVIAILTVVSNGAFLLVVSRSRRLQTVHNILLISLSITDFFTGVVVTPITATAFIFLKNKKYPCVLFWLRIISFHAVGIISFGTLALISFEKYLAILHTYFYERIITKRKLTLMAVAIGIFGTTYSLTSHLIGLRYYNVYRLLWMIIPYLGITFYVAIFYCYGKIFQEIKKVNRRISAQNTARSDHIAVREGSKVAMTTAMVIGALTMCYFPALIAYTLWPVNEKQQVKKKLEVSMKHITNVIVLLNSTLNPMIYYVKMSSVRRELKHIFCPRKTSA